MRSNKHFLMLVGVLFVSLWQWGCPAPPCTGQVTCACDDAKPCDKGLVCSDGACRSTAEAPSTERITDAAGDAGGADAPDNAARCDAGSQGCRCTVHDGCDAGLRCMRGVCQVCAVGTAGCACDTGDKCSKGSICEAGVCKGCEGQANCACYANNRCDQGSRCQVAGDGSSLCVPCAKQGEGGCECEGDGDCAGALRCINQRCDDASSLADLPKQPSCYAPCEGNIRERDGSIRTCHPAHRLLPGCLTGQRCVEGSCEAITTKATTRKRAAYPFCSGDANCPLWQKCLHGRCYSDCKESSQCAAGWTCHAYACRRKCGVSKSACGQQETCQLIANEEGICMPLVTRRFGAASPAAALLDTDTSKTDKTSTQSKEVFVLSLRELAASNLQPRAAFAITNQGTFATQISIWRDADTTKGSNPLEWLLMDICSRYDANRTNCLAYSGKPSRQQPYVVDIPAGQRVFVQLSGADNVPAAHAEAYEGTLRAKSSQMTQLLKISYRKGGSGRWQGQLFSFGNFDDTNVDKFPASTSLDVRSLKNAFLRRWVNFRRNEISYDQFQAILQSLQHRTWQQTRVQNACKTLFSAQSSDDVACYPDSSANGFSVLSNSQREAPVPSGVTSLNFAMDVKSAAGNLWQGRVVTSETLHYPGNPQIQIGFDDAPGAKALSFVKSLQAVADLGGRYMVGEQQSCHNSSDFQKVTTPWMIPGFVMGTYPRNGSLFRNRYACRSQRAPEQVPAGATKEKKDEIQQRNLSLSAANPIPNGRTLRRTLALVDGVLIDNKIFFALVKESFTSPFAAAGNTALSQDWVRYGYLVLRHVSTDFKDADAQGSAPASCTTDQGCSSGETCDKGLCQPPSQLQQVACDPALIKAAYNRTIQSTQDLRLWSSDDLSGLIATLTHGQSSDISQNTALHITRADIGGAIEYTYFRDNKKRYIHYYCEDTRQFDGGPLDQATDCPVDSKVFFFEHTSTEDELRKHSCQTATDGVFCTNVFAQLQTSPDYRADVPYQCATANAAYCTPNRKDLREGKVFFQPSTDPKVFVSPLQPLREALARAFRYRIKFQSRTGKSVGFTPSICSVSSPSLTPYCYDPTVIEQLEQRVNCLESILADKDIRQRMTSATKALLKSFLEHAFSYSNRTVNGVIITDPGFETLQAELKVMLGDEAFTRAQTSRFDLAGNNLFAFEGDTLEPNGVKLSGALGYEMVQLYTSVHYYQSVLDRFYAQTDVLIASFQSSETAFLTAASVTSYVPKLLLAATRKARSWSQIAKVYHAINRGGLAQHVLERAYLSTYVEQLVMTQLLHKLLDILDKSQIPQMRKEIERSTLIYNAALLDMQERYQKVLQKLDLFGFVEGYLPFPALSRSAVASNPLDALRTVLETAKEKLRIAAEKEELAIQSTRSFDTDSASFSSELVKIEQSYNEQLIQLCGELKDGDQSVPAIPRNAHLFRGGAIADPCGLVEGSYLYQSYLQLEQVGLQVSQTKQQRDHLYQRMDLERDRIQTFCDNSFSLGQISWDFQDQKRDLLASRDTTDVLLQSVTRAGMAAMQIAMDRRCLILFGGAFTAECHGAGISTAARLALLAAQETIVTTLQLEQASTKKELLAQQRDFARTSAQSSCNVCPPDEPKCTTEGVARIQSHNYLAQLALELTTFRLQLLTTEYNTRIALSQIQSIQQQAQRLIQQQDDAIALQLEVSAAANDPNKRIYKNDAVIAAERTFQEALQEAYRLTLLYEYYTSQSYERKGELYLIRMIAHGDIQLETYLSRLEQAYRDFEEKSGRPQLRAMVLSLRDDILKIPRIDKDGTPLGLQDRVKAFQEQLADPNNVDPNGYLRFSFPLSIDPTTSAVSPVTYSHKVVYVEAEIKATSRGDDVARIYLEQSGTGMIRLANDEIKYYALPTRIGVLNTFFNGHKTFEADLYQNFRFQDRPLGNTRWSLMFNQVSETTNQDIARDSINDIILYVYYRDFSK